MTTESANSDDSSDTSTLDRVGAFTSTLCAIHCLTFAFLPGVISALGLGVLFVPALEWALVLLALLFASVALLVGWRRHGQTSVVVAFAIGGAGLMGSRVVEEMGIEGPGLPLAVVAAAALVTGHFLNTRYSRQKG